MTVDRISTTSQTQYYHGNNVMLCNGITVPQNHIPYKCTILVHFVQYKWRETAGRTDNTGSTVTP